jgi:hypothetical protein
MHSQDYDNPEVEARWLKEQCKIVQEYLDKEEIRLADVVENPVWFVAPYVALWKTNDLKSDKQNSVWVISGDLPTDYLELSFAQSPAEVLLSFAKRWKKMSKEMLKGKFPKNWRTGNLEDQKELGDLLERRAEILLSWATDDKMWQ